MFLLLRLSRNALCVILSTYSALFQRGQVNVRVVFIKSVLVVFVVCAIFESIIVSSLSVVSRPSPACVLAWFCEGAYACSWMSMFLAHVLHALQAHLPWQLRFLSVALASVVCALSPGLCVSGIASC